MYGTSKPKWNSETQVCEACPDGTPTWSGTECIACPSTTPAWNGSACVACTSTDTSYCEGLGQACDTSTQTCKSCFDVYNTAKPYWNSETGACEACPSATPKWNSSSGACVACPSTTPAWNGSACVACTSEDDSYCKNSNKVCDTTTSRCKSCYDMYGTSKPKWNSSTKVCEACPSATPKWNGSACVACPSTTPVWNGSACVACTSEDDSYCLDSYKVCDTTTNTCKSCYEMYGTSKPKQNGSTCEACPSATPDWNGTACVVACVNNSKCTTDEYCHINQYTSGSNTSNVNYFTDLSGYCRDKGSLGTGYNVRFKTGTQQVWQGVGPMSWWAAQNWCAAHGKQILDIRGTKLDCYQNKRALDIKVGGDGGYCMSSTSSSLSNTLSQQSNAMQDLRKAITSNLTNWTKASTSPNQYNAYNIQLGSGLISSSIRSLGASVLCESIPCSTSSDCPSLNPICNSTTHLCEPCPANRPRYLASIKECVLPNECASNSDCENGEFCYAFASSQTNGECSVDNPNYYSKVTGYCASKGRLGTGYNVRFTTGTKTIWSSDQTMSWWGARNWCAAHGKTLLDISGTKLGCYKNGTTLWSIQPSSEVTGACWASGKSGDETILANQSNAMQDLHNTVEGDDMYVSGWTATDYDVGENSCRSYYAAIGRGSVLSAPRNVYSNFFAALCEGVACSSASDCSSAAPVCNSTTHQCEACPSITPVWNGSACVACPSATPKYSEKLGECVVPNVCGDNSDCPSSKYCSITSYDTKGDCEPINWNYYSNIRGVCQDKGSLGSGYDIRFMSGVGSGMFSKKVWTHDDTMNWWSAQNWCSAHGKKLLDIGAFKLGCYNGTNAWSIGGPNSGIGPCWAAGETARSEPIKDLKKAFGSWRGWTSTNYYLGENSCNIYDLSLSSESVTYNNRASIQKVLCEDESISCSSSDNCPSSAPFCNTMAGKCEPCPDTAPSWNGSACVTCYEMYGTSKPKWNSETETCEACPSATPKWNGSACVACPSTAPIWTGSACVACTSTDTSYCEGLGKVCDTSSNTCKSCYDLYGTSKPKRNGSTCEACPSATPMWDGSACVACPSATPKWSESLGECVASDVCGDNADCEDTQYCNITSYPRSGTCNASNPNYFTNLRGSCEDKGSLGNEHAIRFTTGTKNVWRSSTDMTWWSARNWCLAHGKNLLDISGTKLGCYKNGATLWNIQPNDNDNLCMASGKSDSSVLEDQSEAMQDLRNAFAGYNWTATDQYPGENSCYAYNIYSLPGKVSGSRRSNKDYALCEDIPCLSSSDCPAVNPMCNLTTHQCEACPSTAPIWDNNACVACTSTDTSYCEGLGQVCDISTQTCKSCYEMNTAEPKWNSETKMCEACPDGTDYYAAENLCIKAEFCPITVDPPFQFLPLSDLRCTGSDLFIDDLYFASFVAPTSCVDPVIVKNEISSMTIEGLGKVIVSKNSMSGIDAERFCQNMGLTRLQISATDLQCYADDGVTPFAYEDLSEPVIVSGDGSAEVFDLRISFIAPVNISEPLDVIDNFDDPNGNGDGDIDSPIIPEDSEFIKDGVLKAYSCCAAGQDCSGDISKQSLVMQRIRTAVENNSDAFADGYKCFWLGESGGCQSYGVSFFDAANGKMMRAPYINGIFCHAVCH